MDIMKLQAELKTSDNYIEVTNGVVLSPYDIDEDKYYYYLISSNGSYKMVPVQVVGGIVQELKKVDGTVTEPARNLMSVKSLFTLDDVPIGPELEKLIKEQGTIYKSSTCVQYIDSAKKYAKLRERLMAKVMSMKDSHIFYQAYEKVLPTTNADFSLGYNEDAYIKSSIAYETEMYMRTIFSRYGVLDKDLKTIFISHNIKDAFLKLPRVIRTKIYRTYKEELKRKTLEKTSSMLEEILSSEIIEKLIEKPKIDDIEKLELMKALYESYLSLGIKLSKSAETKIKKIQDIIIITDKKENKQEKYYSNENTENFINGYANSKLKFNKCYQNIKEDTMFNKYIYSIKSYKNYEILDEKYNRLIEQLTELNIIINELQIKIKDLEKEKNKQDNIKRRQGRYTVSDEEYNNILSSISSNQNELAKYVSLRTTISNKITQIENEMATYIFKDSLGMETAYQDNRYTYEDESNNNYEHMLLFLNSIKKVVMGPGIKTINYDDAYRSFYLKKPEIRKRRVITASGIEIRDFDQFFSRKDERFTCKKRKTRQGQISKFFKSKKDSKLDAIYSAELKYLGALLIENEDKNLYMAEIAMASELYLKGLIRSKEETHSLKELFLKADNKVKSMIIRKVNSYLNLSLTKNEFLNVLSKNEIDQAFSNYRYLYENDVNKEDVEFLNAFVRALHLVVSSKRKYYSPYYDEINNHLIKGGEANITKKNN